MMCSTQNGQDETCPKTIKVEMMNKKNTNDSRKHTVDGKHSWEFIHRCQHPAFLMTFPNMSLAEMQKYTFCIVKYIS
jgi:S-formylglutathione hydrolase FrmB